MVPVLGTILDTVYLRSAAIAVAPELCIFVRSDLGGRVGLVLWFFAVWVTSYVQTGVLYIFDGVACAASHDYDLCHSSSLSFSNFAHSGGTRGRRGGAGLQRQGSAEGPQKDSGRAAERCLAIPLSGDSHMVCSHSMFSRSMFSQTLSPRMRHRGWLDHRCVGIGFEVSSGRQSSQLTRCQNTRGQ